MSLGIMLRELANERDGLKKRIASDKEYIESLCADLCKIEDALGFKGDCHDEHGAFIPTIGPLMERLRDLISVEGERGDLKEQLTQSEQCAMELKELCKSITDSNVKAALEMAYCHKRIAQLEQHNEKVQHMILDYKQREAALRQAASDFVHNVKNKHVAGFGDLRADVSADASFRELEKALTPAQKEEV